MPQRPPKPASDSGEEVPALALSHGQTLWLMRELGLCEGVPPTTFNHYVKSLRKLGIPFDKGKGQAHGRCQVTYDFEELMELVLALLLRVYGWLPDDVAVGLRRFRGDLRSIYRQAYLDTRKRRYPPARLSGGGRRITVDGFFLDLNLRYAAGHLVGFGPPQAISPLEALQAYARCYDPARAYLPMNMTIVAEMIVDRTRVVPSIRRGRAAHARR